MCHFTVLFRYPMSPYAGRLPKCSSKRLVGHSHLSSSFRLLVTLLFRMPMLQPLHVVRQEAANHRPRWFNGNGTMAL